MQYNPSTHPTNCFLYFDERMALHCYPLLPTKNIPADSPYERPSRISEIYNHMMKLECRLLSEDRGNDDTQSPPARRFNCRPPQICKRSTVLLAHSESHYNNIMRTASMTDQELRELCELDGDLYYCCDTFKAALLAAGGVVSCVDAVLSAASNGGPTRAIAIVRPPGHHALKDSAMGFCYFNNIAVAAKHTISSHSVGRVFIIDYDIHHGNGIQEITYDDPNIFYCSIHRARFGNSKNNKKDWFYPGTGRPEETGCGAAQGTNLNVAFPTGGMGNAEYAMAFHELILPAMRAFNPDLIIVACGFDAAEGDLLGDCALSPEMYYVMTKSLLDTGTKIPMVVALEGGYDLDTICTCMEATALALLDEPFSRMQVPSTDNLIISTGSVTLSRYWTQSGPNKAKRVAVKAVKKTAQELAKTKRFQFLLNCGGPRGAPLRRLSPSSIKRDFVRCPVVPLCNRPVQPIYVDPDTV